MDIVHGCFGAKGAVGWRCTLQQMAGPYAASWLRLPAGIPSFEHRDACHPPACSPTRPSSHPHNRPPTRLFAGAACDSHAYSTWPWVLCFGGAMILLSQVCAGAWGLDRDSEMHG